MVTLDRILDVLESLGIKELIVADTAIDFLGEKQKESFKYSFIADVRSAGFFALGKTQTLQQGVALLVESKYISHLYTSMVEIWFQQMPVVVIVLDTNDDFDYSLLHRCVRQAKDYRDSEDYKELTIADNGPTLLIIHAANSEQVVDISSVKKLLPKDAQIYKPTDKYGAISKYVGFLYGTKNEVYCLIPLSWVKFDLNIFNNRNLDKRFKLILHGEMADIPCELEQWLTSNQIELIDGSIKEGMDEFVNNNRPSVIIIK